MAAEASIEEAGNEQYTRTHMSAILKEGFSFSGYERDYLALSVRGERFVDVSGVSGIDSIGDGRGAAFADFDNDGDLDVLLVSLQRRAHELFRNDIGQDAGFIRVALRGEAPATDAFGAVVRVRTPAGIQTKIKSGGSGFLAQHDPRLLFGLDGHERAEWIEVTWPDGRVQRIDSIDGVPGVPAGASLLVGQDGSVTRVRERRFTLVDPLSDEQQLLTTLAFAPGDRFPDLRLLPAEAIPGGDALTGPAAASVYGLLRPGRRLLVNLWATWCLPCRREMPELARLAGPLRDRGVDLVGVSIDRERLEAVPGFAREVGADYPIYVTDDERVPELFAGGQVAIPLSVLLDDSGRVLEVIGGWSEASAKRFDALAGGAAGAEAGGHPPR